MKKLVIGLLMLGGAATAAVAAHNPTPPEGYRNYGQCMSALVKEQNEVRKDPDAYTPEMADDINTATCDEQVDGSYRIIFS